MIPMNMRKLLGVGALLTMAAFTLCVRAQAPMTLTLRCDEPSGHTAFNARLGLVYDGSFNVEKQQTAKFEDTTTVTWFKKMTVPIDSQAGPSNGLTNKYEPIGVIQLNGD